MRRAATLCRKPPQALERLLDGTLPADAGPRGDPADLAGDCPGGNSRRMKTIATEQGFRMAIIRGMWYDPPRFGPGPLPGPQEM